MLAGFSALAGFATILNSLMPLLEWSRRDFLGMIAQS
jgi:hypothetical protein